MHFSARAALTRLLGGVLLVAAVGLVSFEGAAIAAPDAAQGAEATEQAPASRAARGKKRQQKPVATSASQQSRHEVCLAFLRRHGYTCDTWVEPTCGADSGYFRPPECVRPH
jgi:hypothetical protein